MAKGGKIGGLPAHRRCHMAGWSVYEGRRVGRKVAGHRRREEDTLRKNAGLCELVLAKRMGKQALSSSE